MGFSGSVNGTTKNPGFLDFGFCQCKWAYYDKCEELRKQIIIMKAMAVLSLDVPVGSRITTLLQIIAALESSGNPLQTCKMIPFD